MEDNNNLRRRLVTGFLVITLISIVTFYFPDWAFALLTSAVIGVALSEFFKMAEGKGIFVYKYLGVAIGMCVPVVLYLQRESQTYFALEPFFLVIASLFIFVLQFTRRDNSQALSSIAITLFGLLYVAWFLSFFVKLKLLPHGALLVAFVILVTKTCDVGAYFIGRAFGSHALIPRISPHKTIEGTVGGLVSSVICAVISKSYMPDFSYTSLVGLGLAFGVLGTLGDLAESVLKRDCGVKDSGKNLSGYGGIMDVIDSLLFTTPIFYFYVIVIVRQ